MNRVLRHANARIESLTLERMEDVRLHKIDKSGYFDGQPFPIPRCFEQTRAEAILEKIQSCEQRFRCFDEVSPDAVSFS